ncbi:MAG TPA: hypothetical protein VGW57_05010 [Chthoniobacterales bacterium]|nr:hypothetical protein [Chthoniobacterales bacterium]
MRLKSGRAISTFIASVILCSTTLAPAASVHVDANGNALADSEAGDAPEDKEAELAKQLQNPVASLISVPFQNNFDFNLGSNDDGFKYTLNFQPVIPVSLGKDWNLIIRTIVPIISQNDVIPNTSQSGLGDIVQSFFFSPKKPVGGLILGFGPVLLYPTATDSLLGSEQWGAGPTGLVLKQTGGWTYGLLFNHIWSYTRESGRNYVSSTFLQPFISYTTKTKTTFGLNTESTYDWHNSQWTIPINLSVSQLIKVGKMPVSLGLGVKYYAETPSGGPDWGVRFIVTPLFPTGSR